jgi:hypothetical protein
VPLDEALSASELVDERYVFLNDGRGHPPRNFSLRIVMT